jgi:predicted dehydrogenase
MVHLEALDAHNGVELCAIAESNPDVLRDAAQRARISVTYEDWRLAIDDDRVEAVVICLPTGLHADAATAAFEAGKHVYVEKPVATTAEDARRVADAWRASGKVGVVGFNQRFQPVIRRLKRSLQTDEVGQVTSAFAVMSSEARKLPEWKRMRASGGGALLDLGSHVVDTTRCLFERRIVDVFGAIELVRTEDDTAAFTMRLDGGPTIQAQVTLAGILETRFEVLGDGGRLIADRNRGTVTLEPLHPPYGRVAHARAELTVAARGAKTIVRPPRPMASNRALIDAFIDAVTNGRHPSPDIEDGCRSLDVVLAVEEAHRTGKTVEISTVHS